MTLSSVETLDDLSVTEDVKAVIDAIIPEWVWQEAMYSLSCHNFQRVCMELRMQSSLEDGE